MSETIEPIDKGYLAAQHKKLCRDVASVMIEAIGQAGMDYPEIEARMGVKPGFVKKWLNKLIEGKTPELRDISDLCTVLGVVPRFGFHPLEDR